MIRFLQVPSHRLVELSIVVNIPRYTDSPLSLLDHEYDINNIFKLILPCLHQFHVRYTLHLTTDPLKTCGCKPTYIISVECRQMYRYLSSENYCRCIMCFGARSIDEDLRDADGDFVWPMSFHQRLNVEYNAWIRRNLEDEYFDLDPIP